MMEIVKEIQKHANPDRAKLLQRFFKTGKDQYGEGDVFLGLTVPEVRTIAKKYQLPLKNIQTLLKSKIHEHRLVALLILVNRYKRDTETFNFYIKNTKYVNNWDLVDLSCHKIVGDYLLDKNRSVLYRLVKGMLWERRIAIVSTYAFIRNNDLNDTFKIAELLLNDKHDLMHKAAGWMLREAGKKNRTRLEKFLEKHRKAMPRTMLRYSIEKLPEAKRKYYMKK